MHAHFQRTCTSVKIDASSLGACSKRGARSIRQIRCFGSTTLSGPPTRRPHCPKDCGVGVRCDKRLTRDDAAHGLRCAETTMSSRACHAAMRLEAKVQAWPVIEKNVLTWGRR